MKKLTKKDLLFISILLLFWGTYSSISKLLLDGIDSFSVLFYMYLSSAIVITLYMIVTKKIKKVFVKTNIKYTLVAPFSFIYYILYFVALKKASAIEITTINYLFPLLIPIFAIVINKERLSPKNIFALLLGFLGVFIIVTGGNVFSFKLTNMPADIIMLIAAISWAIMSTLSKKHVKDQYSFTFIAIWVQLILTAIVLPLFTSIQIPTLGQLTASVWLGLSNIVVGFIIWQTLLKTLPISTVSSIAFLTPIVNFLSILIIIGEKVTIAKIFGFALVVSGIIVQRSKMKAGQHNDRKRNIYNHG